MSDTLLPSGLWVSTHGKIEGKANRIDEQLYSSANSVPDWSAISKFTDYNSFLGAIRIPWVYACASVICYNAADTEITMLEDGEEVDDTDVDPFMQLLERPNPQQSRFQFLELAIMYLLLTGNVYIALEEIDADGLPREMYLPNPSRMRIKPGPDGPMAYLYDVGLGKQSVFAGYSNRFVPYMPDEIIHIRMPNPTDDYYGMGVIEASQTIMDIVTAMSQQELSYWQSGGRITGALETDSKINDRDFDKLKREWQLANAGKKQKIGTVILQQGLKYTPIAEGFRSLDLVNIDKGKRDTILGCFGVPLPKLGIMEQAQYKMDEADAFFWQETEGPIFGRLEDGFQPLVDRFNPSRCLEWQRKTFEDDQYKIQNAGAMFGSGYIRLDEARAIVGLDPLPNGSGNVLMVSTTAVPVRLEDMTAYAQEAVAPQPAIAPPAPPLRLTAPGDTVPTEEQSAAEQELAAAAKRWDARRMEAEVSIKRRRARHDRKSSSPIDRANKATKATKATKANPIQAHAVERDFNRVKPAIIEKAKPLIRDAFRTQQRAMVERIETFKRALGMKDADKRKDAMRRLLDPTPILDALVPLWSEAVPEGAQIGQSLLPHKSAVTLDEKTRSTGVGRGHGRHHTGPRGSHTHPNGVNHTHKGGTRSHVHGVHAHPVHHAITRHATGATMRHAHGPARMSHVHANMGAMVAKKGIVTDVKDTVALPPELTDKYPRMGDRINRSWQQIDDTTFGQIIDSVETGIQRGYSPMQIANGYPDEEFPGIAGAFDDAIGYRTDMIARTESANALNWGAWQSYADAGVGQIEAIDGDDDEPCATRNGEWFDMDLETGEPIDNGLGIEDHPNGRLMFAPVVDSMTSIEPS